ncbi:MAG: Gfo/Idh/MocA family oxidoreductase [Planctomycetota bacterium]|nr:MAG: Gfo/Idh/MocA family oxidoreductase [Planctomycetota bacterium]
MSDVGIGVIGSGFMGRTYSEVISKYCSGATLKAVTCGSRAAELAKDYGMDLEPSVDSLLVRDDISAVFITTPHHVHAEQSIASARAGKHMLIEKPMACTVDECDAILDACKAAGVYSSIAFSQRTRKCNIKAKQLIDEGAIGRIVQMEEMSLVSIGLEGLPKWQSDPENLGTLFGHAIHNFDRIRWFSGKEIKTVYAKCGSIDPKAKVELSSMLLMTLQDGTPVSLWSCYEAPKPSFPRSQFSVRIIGEKGLIDLDAYGELRIATDGEWKVAETQEPIDWQGKGFLDPVRLESYTLQCQDFIDAVANKKPPVITGWDGRQAVAAALAAYESSASGKEIMLSS